MTYPADDIDRVKELAEQGESQCGIERYTGISYFEVRRILGRDKSQPPPTATQDLSIRERQRLLNWRAA